MKISEKHKDFFQQVYDVVKLIPCGRVTTYGAIAKVLSTPKSSRVVGWAMNAAHSDPEIPAHRVVNRKGLLTGKMHFQTPTTMQNMLEKEGVIVVEDQIQQFESVFWNPSEYFDSYN